MCLRYSMTQVKFDLKIKRANNDLKNEIFSIVMVFELQEARLCIWGCFWCSISFVNRLIHIGTSKSHFCWHEIFQKSLFALFKSVCFLRKLEIAVTFTLTINHGVNWVIYSLYTMHQLRSKERALKLNLRGQKKNCHFWKVSFQVWGVILSLFACLDVFSFLILKSLDLRTLICNFSQHMGIFIHRWIELEMTSLTMCKLLLDYRRVLRYLSKTEFLGLKKQTKHPKRKQGFANRTFSQVTSHT